MTDTQAATDPMITARARLITVKVEKCTSGHYRADSPQVPGFSAASPTWQGLEGAISLHLNDMMKASGQPYVASLVAGSPSFKQTWVLFPLEAVRHGIEIHERPFVDEPSR